MAVAGGGKTRLGPWVSRGGGLAVWSCGPVALTPPAHRDPRPNLLDGWLALACLQTPLNGITTSLPTLPPPSRPYVHSVLHMNSSSPVIPPPGWPAAAPRRRRRGRRGSCRARRPAGCTPEE